MPASTREAVEVVAAVERADVGRMLQRARLVEAVGHGQRAAVIGDGDVLEAGVARRPRHRPGVGAAVGGRRVHVQVAAHVLEGDEPRQRAGFGGLDLAAILAQFRRDERQPERLVDALLGLAGDERAVVHAIEPVFVQLEAALDRAVAQGDVVGSSSR